MSYLNSRITYGAVLKVDRELSLEQIQDMLLDMKNAGLDTAVIWPAVYWWEDDNPRYPYNTGCEILAYAEQIGLDIIMELAGQITALEYGPDFKMKDEYYCVDQKGCRDCYGEHYGFLNFNHPEVIELLQNQYREIAAHYKDYSSLAGYDIWNETVFSSFDTYTQSCFQQWLKDKYGSIEKLNDVWDRVYRSWDQVQFTPWKWASVMAFVDYQQFRKANIAIIIEMMKKPLREITPATPILADNGFATVAVDAMYDRSDDWAVARNVDHYGISFYPKLAPGFFFSPAARHQILTGAHSASKDGVFAITEMQTHHTQMFLPETGVNPQDLRQWCIEAVSHGAKGIIYWKWNPFAKGMQTFGRGLVNHKGESSPRLAAAQNIQQLLAADPGFQTAMPAHPSIAILYDSLNHDFIKAYASGALGSLYTDSLSGLYQTLWSANVPGRFVVPAELEHLDPQKHPLLYVTNQLVMDSQMANALRVYMGKGGWCVFDGKFAEINEQGLLYPTIPGAELTKSLGFELMDMETGDLSISIQNSGLSFDVSGAHDRRQFNSDVLTAEVIGTYSDGRPAVVKKNYGEGGAYYLSTFFWYGLSKQPDQAACDFAKALTESHWTPSLHCSNTALHVEQLEGENFRMVFVFNYGNDLQNSDLSVKFEGVQLEGTQVYELTDNKPVPCHFANGQVNFNIDVAANSIMIYKVCCHA